MTNSSSFLTKNGAYQSYLPKGLPKYVRPACEISQEEAAALNGLYGGVEA
jgi:hypothetical protein